MIGINIGIPKQPTGGSTALGGTPSTQAFGDSASQGSSTAGAKSDHKHAMPANPIIESGIATLVNGTIVVNSTNVTAISKILLTGENLSVNIGSLWVSDRVVGVSFTISSSNILDTRDVAWVIIQ